MSLLWPWGLGCAGYRGYERVQGEGWLTGAYRKTRGAHRQAEGRPGKELAAEYAGRKDLEGRLSSGQLTGSRVAGCQWKLGTACEACGHHIGYCCERRERGDL